MILAPRPPFRASGRPQGPGIRGSSRNIAQRFPRILGLQSSPITGFSAPLPGQQCKEFRARSSGQGVPGEATPPCRFPMSPPVLESQRGSSVRVSSMRVSGSAARLANQPRASLHRDCHQGQFTAICCTSLHSGTQHNPFPQPQGLFIFSK